jgi:hypothetical protein
MAMAMIAGHLHALDHIAQEVQRTGRISHALVSGLRLHSKTSQEAIAPYLDALRRLEAKRRRSRPKTDVVSVGEGARSLTPDQAGLSHVLTIPSEVPFSPTGSLATRSTQEPGVVPNIPAEYLPETTNLLGWAFLPRDVVEEQRLEADKARIRVYGKGLNPDLEIIKQHSRMALEAEARREYRRLDGGRSSIKKLLASYGVGNPNKATVPGRSLGAPDVPLPRARRKSRGRR